MEIVSLIKEFLESLMLMQAMFKTLSANTGVEWLSKRIQKKLPTFTDVQRTKPLKKIGENH